MPLIPLGQGAYKRASAFTPEVELLNLYLEEDKSGVSPDNTMRIQRPSLVPFSVLPAPARAIFRQDGVFGGAAYAVAGQYFCSITGGIVGDVGAGGHCAMAATVFGVFIVSDFKLWLWDGATLFNIVVPAPYQAVDVDVIDGYAVVACTTGRFYWVEPGATIIDPLNFATAESSPDTLVSVRRVSGELWFFGATSIEPWQPTGDLDAPFQRASGRVYARGCLSARSVRRFDNSVVWVGEDGVVYRGDSTPTRISDHGVEERIRRATARDTVAMTIETDGHKFYVLRIGAEATMCFDASTQGWCAFSSLGLPYWRGWVSPPDNNDYVADSNSGAVYTVDATVPTDAGEAYPRIVTGTVPTMGSLPRNDSFSLGISSSADCTVIVRWKDGQDDYPDFPEYLEARAPLDVVNLYRLGMPDQPYRTFEVSVTDPVQIRIAGCKVNEAWD